MGWVVYYNKNNGSNALMVRHIVLESIKMTQKRLSHQRLVYYVGTSRHDSSS